MPDLRKSVRTLNNGGERQGIGDGPAEPNLIPASTGIGRGGNAASSTESYTEEIVGLREYWPETDIYTTDGIFTFRVKPIKKVVMKNAIGREVTFLYANPYG